MVIGHDSGELRMKSALITGAARGIGLATAKMLLESGWRVAMLDRDADVLMPEVDNLVNARGIVADVSDPDQVAQARATLAAEFGSLDALVNNAGCGRFWTD